MNIIIIGESINDSVSSTHQFFESGNFAEIEKLAIFQDDKGANYIDVNVGSRSPEFMSEIVQVIQKVVRKPLSIDTPSFEMAEAALRVYDDSVGIPILNSISARRLEMFDLMKLKPFRPILLISESEQGACKTAAETVEAAKFMREKAISAGITNEDMIFDPGIAPIGLDIEGNLPRLMESLRQLQADSDFSGTHRSVGLSNFTVMLPPKRKDGSLIKVGLESAFLTRAIPLGLDYIIGSVKRTYSTLPPENDAQICFDECTRLIGFDSVLRVRKFYNS
ncbi:MAG: dihydropteroate synthase [Thermoguttaceae bacterium]